MQEEFTCTSCKCVKQKTNFPTRKDGKYGIKYTCKVCLKNKYSHLYKAKDKIRNKKFHLDHPLCSVLSGMKSRCLNKNENSYSNYGGRGITVCEEWLTGYKEFEKWAYDNGYKKGLAIDRINNDGNYEPSNCRFVTQEENNQNRRSTKLNWDIVKCIREKANLYTRKELAAMYGIYHSHVAKIINNERWVV